MLQNSSEEVLRCHLSKHVDQEMLTLCDLSVETVNGFCDDSGGVLSLRLVTVSHLIFKLLDVLFVYLEHGSLREAHVVVLQTQHVLD